MFVWRLSAGIQIILQPPYLCSLHTCSPKAQAPKGIIQESLVLQPSELLTKIQDLFRPPEVITSPTLHLLHLQLSTPCRILAADCRDFAVSFSHIEHF